MYKRILVIAALTLASATAFAIPKPSEVKAAVVSGDYARAETLLKEVMVERPTATVHYQLGQVYAKEGRHAEALNEYRQAQALDPTLKFASSASAFTSVLANEQDIVAPPTATPRTVYNTGRSVSGPADPTYHTSNVKIMIVLLLFVPILLLVMYLLYGVYERNKEKKLLTDKKTADSKENTNALLTFAKQLEDASLIAKTSTYSDLSKRQILDRIVVLQSTVRSMLADVKDGGDIYSGRMATLESNIETAVENATNGLPVLEQKIEPATKVKSNSKTQNIRNTKTKTYTSPAPTPEPTPQVVHHYHETTTPVVQNSGSDMLTGIMIGNILSDHRDHTVYVERERPAYDAPRRERDTYDEPPRSAPSRKEPEEDSYTPSSDTFDSGSSGNDTYDSGSSSSSSDFDSGSSSDDSF